MSATIGQIFSLCGTAQTVAALTAIEAALDIAPTRGWWPRVTLARRPRC